MWFCEVISPRMSRGSTSVKDFLFLLSSRGTGLEWSNLIYLFLLQSSSVNLVPVGERKGAKDHFKLNVLFASLTVKQK